MNVFITGASSGIGAALARHYAGTGANLGLVARRQAPLDQLVSTLPAQGRVIARAGDVRVASELSDAATAFVARFGVPDIVIANAGISQGTSTEHADDAAVFRAILDTNVLGIVHSFQPFLAAMRERRCGTLVGIASVAGFRGLPGAGAYSASKAAAIAYLESLRVELLDSGLQVVTVCPGYVATPMTAKNPYRMPFLVDADRGARLIARAIERQRHFYVFPWPMAIVGWALRALPRPLYGALFRNAPRKPRRPA